MYELAIIIVNYKTPDLVIDSIQSFIDNGVECKVCIVVVDNASNDSSVKDIIKYKNNNKSKYDIKIVESNKNEGFSAGNNLGIRAINARNYLLLNSDTLVRKGAIKELINIANNNRDYGIIPGGECRQLQKPAWAGRAQARPARN